MAKNVLILGNGFDLAHGLPTKYSHFLMLCRGIVNINNNELTTYRHIDDLVDQMDYNPSAKDMIKQEFDNAKHRGQTISQYKFVHQVFEKMAEQLVNNCWYDYLIELYLRQLTIGENWIDFESEIRYIIQLLDENCNNLSHSYGITVGNITENIKSTQDYKSKFSLFDNIMKEYIKRNENELSSMRKIRKKLYSDLKNLTYALELYLLNFTDASACKYRSPDIIEKQFDYIINFNYTNTYRQIYKKDANVFYIHGFCENDREKENNNMVLGIDEYWSDEEKDSHTNFTIFKKFAQRILNKTGIKHIELHAEMKNEYDPYAPQEKSHVYVFGHSLDITDKDILKLFLNEDEIMVTIFCYDEGTEGECISNVIKIIGEEKLLEKVNQYPPQIEFIIQRDMQTAESEETNEQECPV